MRDFEDNGHWKAEDYRQFILSMVGLISSQRRFLPDLAMYHVLRHLADLVYLMYTPRMTDSIIAEIKRSMKQFVDAYHARIGIAGCTWKFHIFHHFIELIERHGSALFFYGFFRECVIGELKKFLSATWNEDEQIVANFLLTHHATRYFESCRLSPRMKTFCESQAPKMTGKSVGSNVALSFKPDPAMESDEIDVVRSFYGASLGQKQVKRVNRLKHGGTVITSERWNHRGNVDDSWVFFDEENFGRVEDIFVVDGEEEKSFVLKLLKYRKVSVMDEMSSEGDELAFPINQFPAESDDEVEYIYVDHAKNVQMMSVGTYEYVVSRVVVGNKKVKEVLSTPYLAVWPQRA
jgi:hypothetical protein